VAGDIVRKEKIRSQRLKKKKALGIVMTMMAKNRMFGGANEGDQRGRLKSHKSNRTRKQKRAIEPRAKGYDN
jgi:hypothetical protein